MADFRELNTIYKIADHGIFVKRTSSVPVVSKLQRKCTPKHVQSNPLIYRKSVKISLFIYIFSFSAFSVVIDCNIEGYK